MRTESDLFCLTASLQGSLASCDNFDGLVGVAYRLPLHHAREFLAGNLAASPSIPRGMSPHGARWLWVPFDGVGSCGGGAS